MTSPSQPLAAVTGRIVLAGAGKMGGALLTGWLKAGLSASQLVAIEPTPSDEINKLTAQGLSLNPSLSGIGDVAALVIAVKPQTFAEAAMPLKPLVRTDT